MELDSTTIFVLEIIGLIAFALSGALAAAKKQLDIVGFIVVATITGCGGGTIRNMILGVPAGWLSDAYIYPISVCVVIAIAAYFFAKYFEKGSNLINWCDAAGLAVFAVQGYFVSAALRPSLSIAIIMGLITGVGGGLLRDICLNRQPFIFRGEVYTLAAAIGLLGLWATGSIALSLILIFGIRGWTIITVSRKKNGMAYKIATVFKGEK